MGIFKAIGMGVDLFTGGTGIGTAIGSGLDASKASKKAANQSSAGYNDATALQRQMYNETVARNKPFVEGGTNAFNSLLDRLGLSGNTAAPGYNSFGKAPTSEEVMAQPGYQFALNQGQSALERQLNARGHYYSPQAEQRLLEHNQNYATKRYGDEYNRRVADDQNQYNRLSGVANLGQSSANNTAAAGQQFAGAYGQNAIGSADAQANSTLSQSSIWQNAIDQSVSAYGKSKRDQGFGMGPDGPYLGPVQWQKNSFSF